MMRRRVRLSEKFVSFLKQRIRYGPENITKIYEGAEYAIGLYKKETQGILSALGDKKIKSLVEIGRCLGGGLYMLSCIFPELEEILSIDINDYYITDPELKLYFDHFGIKHNLIIADSTKYVPEDRLWDFVFIDGGHTGEIVSKDIAIWKDRCRYIGFHDYSNRKGRNRHKAHYPDVVEEIKKSIKEYSWRQIGVRGRSEIVLETKNV